MKNFNILTFNTYIKKMKMFAVLDKAKPHTENVRGLNLAAVTFKCSNVYTAVVACITIINRAWFAVLSGFSPRANYTDRTTAACRRS
jgi:hypothetical protein